jgi:hypothetical protein
VCFNNYRSHIYVAWGDDLRVWVYLLSSGLGPIRPLLPYDAQFLH